MTAELTAIDDPEAEKTAAQRRLLGALLFAAGGPMTEEEIRSHLPGADVQQLTHDVGARFRWVGLELRRSAGGWDLVTAPDLAHSLKHNTKRERAVSRAALEVLAVIAHNQPCTRTHVSKLRGTEVGSSVLATLQEAGWIAIKRGKPGPNGASLWVTTDAFLVDFGYEDLAELHEGGERF